MSIEEEIKMAETTIIDIETYVRIGVWHPDRQEQIAKEIVDADEALDQLMIGHSMKLDVLSEKQVKIVADLLKRFNTSQEPIPRVKQLRLDGRQ